MQLIRAFLVHFDQLCNNKDFILLCNYINEQLKLTSKKSGRLAAYAHYSNVIFNVEGPAVITKLAHNGHVDLEVQFSRMGLRGFNKSRFMFLSRSYYYITTLQNIDVGERHDVLKELCNLDVANAPFEKNRLIGHKALEILIDRSEGKPLSPKWQSTILTIAGDPRVPKSDQKFQQWWVLLGEKRQSLMRGWLSRFDLKLFLKVLEQSAKEVGDEEITRMFKPRKKFMEGLLISGVITESRLFLSRYAENYLKRQYKPEDLPSYAQVESARTSMIYLNIQNKIHILEGSHSFPLKLFEKLAKTSPLNNYSVSHVTDTDLRRKEEGRYIREYGDQGYISQAHYDMTWQNTALNFLKQRGIHIPISSVIRRDALRYYKTRYGAD